MNRYQQGNTIQMTATFKNWDGEPVDPVIVKFILYDNLFNKIDDTGMVERTDLGAYRHFYTPSQPGDFYYEWYGEVDGLPSLKRERIEIRRF